jgi:hypothetical protein
VQILSLNQFHLDPVVFPVSLLVRRGESQDVLIAQLQADSFRHVGKFPDIPQRKLAPPGVFGQGG